MPSSSSQLRQRLLELAKRYDTLLQQLLHERGPLIRGSYGTRARVCGAPGCRCARGELHTSKYLTATDGGKVRQVHVPLSDEEEVATGVARYRRFYRSRTRLAKLVKDQLRLLDQLGELLRKPYPPERPLPPAGQRGPGRRKRGDGAR